MPVDSALLARKAEQLQRALARVRVRLPRTAAALAKDLDAQDIVFYNYQIAVQNCVDMASHVVVERGWPPAATMGGTFERLAEHGVLPPPFSRRLRDLVALRNILVHDYARVNLSFAWTLVRASLRELPRFSRTILGKRK
jgi:uncharacterized protein YutE (UPF0331/DUF86 family)